MPRVPAKKPAPKRAPENVRTEAPRDTPSPPTMPTPEPEPASKPKATKPRSGTLEHRLAEALASAAIIPAFTGDQYSAFILSTRSAKFAHDLSELAKVNATLKRGLENLLDGGAYGGVMFSGAAMLLPILWSYGVIPAPPLDPFGAFYDPVPAGVLPRSVQVRSSKRNAGSADSRKANGQSSGSAPASRVPTGGEEPPEGVVTVRPSAVPPINPAAL